MDLNFSPEDEAFRTEVRTWLAENLPDNWRQTGGVGNSTPEEDREVQRKWQRRLYDGGWLKLLWPADMGGRGGTPVMQAIYQQESAAAGAPEPLGRTGALLHAPTLMRVGTDWQKEKYVDGLLSGDIVFCQAWSEPGSGSDLASVRTRAERVDGKWAITGQKIWTGGAHYADKALLLARTDPALSKHAGLGMFIVDMKQPGVRAVPIRQMIGRPIGRITGSNEFCEVYFDGAVVEDRDLVLSPTDGWKITSIVAGFERSFLTNPFKYARTIDNLVALANAEGKGDDPLTRQRVAQAAIEAHLFYVNSLRSLSRAQQGHPPGPEASMTKLFWSEMNQQRLQEAAIGLQGMRGALDPDDPGAPDEGVWHYKWMFSQAETIYGGTSDIQRNQIARRVLELPKE